MGRRRQAGVAGTAVGALVSAILLPGQVLVSDASWRQDEHVRTRLGTLDCSRASGFATRGAGRLVGGSLLGDDPGSLAVVSGVTVTSDGARSQAHGPAERVDSHTWANPVELTALGAVRLSSTGTLDDALEVGAGNTIGTVNQVGHAESSGPSYGASGVVSDSGAVMLDAQTSTSAPGLGTLRLSRLVESLTGRAVSDIVAGVSDLSLGVGAVASRAGLDACRQAWDADDPGALTRQYAVAGLDADLESPLVTGLGTAGRTALDDVLGTAGGLDQDADVVGDIGSGVSALLDPVLGGLRLGLVSVSGPSVTLDLSAVRGLLSTTVSDDDQTVRLDLATGSVRIDLAALLGRAYGGRGMQGGAGLNELDPNTELVLNDQVTTTLVARLGEALDGWVADVVAATRTALLAARVSTTVRITLQGTVKPPLAPPVTLDVARLDTVVEGTLADLLAGGGSVTAAVQMLPAPLGLGALVNALVSPLVSGLEGAATRGAGKVVGDALQEVLLSDDSPLGELGSTLSAAVGSAVSALSSVVNAYLGPDGLVSVVANAQNRPVGGGRYAEWETGRAAVPTGQYDVAALSLRVLSTLGPERSQSLELARASVGPSCPPGEVTTQVCADY